MAATQNRKNFPARAAGLCADLPLRQTSILTLSRHYLYALFCATTMAFSHMAIYLPHIPRIHTHTLILCIVCCLLICPVTLFSTHNSFSTPPWYTPLAHTHAFCASPASPTTCPHSICLLFWDAAWNGDWNQQWPTERRGRTACGPFVASRSDASSIPPAAVADSWRPGAMPARPRFGRFSDTSPPSCKRHRTAPLHCRHPLVPAIMAYCAPRARCLICLFFSAPRAVPVDCAFRAARPARRRAATARACLLLPASPGAPAFLPLASHRVLHRGGQRVRRRMRAEENCVAGALFCLFILYLPTYTYHSKLYAFPILPTISPLQNFCS